MIAAALLLLNAWTWHGDATDKLELRLAGKPVYVYNAGPQLAANAPTEKRRCCYVHPLYAPNGTVVTDDFPKDHWHHRGLFWSWPVVLYKGRKFDMWMMTGALVRRGVHVRHEGPVLEAENVWELEGRPVVKEQVRIEASGGHLLHLTLTLAAVEAPVELSGAPEEAKGYGGLSLRFAPRAATAIRTDDGVAPEDSNMQRHPWAELSAKYRGLPATVRIDDDPRNPGYPNGWCIRHYGFLGVNYPGTATVRLHPGQPLTLRYQVKVQ